MRGSFLLAPQLRQKVDDVGPVYLINLNSTTSTRPKSVSLNWGITGKARKERMANGAGGQLPRLAAAFSTLSCCATTTSSGSVESSFALALCMPDPRLYKLYIDDSERYGYLPRKYMRRTHRSYVMPAFSC